MPDDGAPRPDAATLLTRRAALQRAALLLGGSLGAGTVAGVLAGCGERGGAPRGAGDTAALAARAAPAYRLQALTPEQARLVSAVAEQILPETDTPGARAARVDEFVDRMLAEFHTADERARFVAGLDRLDARARRRHGRAFADCAPGQQFALVDALDAQAFPASAPAAGTRRGDAPAGAGENAAGVSAQREPETRNPNEAAGHSYTQAAGAPSGAADSAGGGDDRPDPADAGPKAFFRTMKELTLVGYYTSEVGATRELRVNPMGRYRGDVPYAAVRTAWA
jgi:hypothetical protein